MNPTTIRPLGAVYTEGGGCVLAHGARGRILTGDLQTLVRLTVTGHEGRTVHVYLDRAQRDAVVASLLAASLDEQAGPAGV